MVALGPVRSGAAVLHASMSPELGCQDLGWRLLTRKKEAASQMRRSQAIVFKVRIGPWYGNYSEPGSQVSRSPTAM
jgi:hypothetical protein